MDPIYQIYTESVTKDSILEMSNVKLSDLPADKRGWESEITKLTNTLTNKFRSPLLFKVSKVDWDSGVHKDKKYTFASFTIDITIDVGNSKYIESIPYINLTGKFFKELQDAVKTAMPIVDKVSFNNTGTTFWTSVVGEENA